MEGFENEYNGCDQSKVNDGYENDIETNKERVEQQPFSLCGAAASLCRAVVYCGLDACYCTGLSRSDGIRYGALLQYHRRQVGRGLASL